jgi:transcriptional regulator with XRE-family HTH domain
VSCLKLGLHTPRPVSPALQVRFGSAPRVSSGTLCIVETEQQALEALGTDHLGGRLRALRQERGFSLRELAARLGISVSAVSQIERGKLQPSVNRLIAIVSALGVPLARVFDETARDGASGASATGYVLARAGEIGTVELEDGVLYRRLSPGETRGVDFFESTYPPGSHVHDGNALITHVGYEVGTVELGELTIRFEHEEVALGPGDSITFPCDVPHRISNQGAQIAIATWLIVHGQS